MIQDDRTHVLTTYNYQYYVNNIIINILIILITIILIYIISKKYNYINKKTLYLLFLYHSAIVIFVNLTTLYGKTDARAYFYNTVHRIQSNLTLADIYGYGVHFIYTVQYPLIKYLKLTYFSVTMLFGWLGYLGLLFLYAGIGGEVRDSKKALKYLQLSLFIPGMSWWASSIGKDSIVFFAICLVIYALCKFRTRYIFLLIAFILMAVARPYSLAITTTALLIAVILSKNLKIYVKLISIVCILILSITIVVKIFSDTYGVDNIDEAGQLIEGQQGTWGGGSDVDISHYNIVFKILTFLYRPLFIDANSIYAVLASMENLIVIYLTFSILTISFLNYFLKNKNILLKFNYFLIIIGVVIMSHTNANLGTAVRKKIMVMPSIISVFILYTYYRDKNKLVDSKSKKKFITKRS
jgi:hypothetical protein